MHTTRGSLTAALACVASAAAAFRSASPPAEALPRRLTAVVLPVPVPEALLLSGWAACGGKALTALLPALCAASAASRAPPLLSGSWKWLLGPEAHAMPLPLSEPPTESPCAALGAAAAAAGASCDRIAAARCSAALSHRPSPLAVRRMPLLLLLLWLSSLSSEAPTGGDGCDSPPATMVAKRISRLVRTQVLLDGATSPRLSRAAESAAG
jgi:hypothetical protein